VNVEVDRYGVINGVEEPKELDGTMAGLGLVENLAGSDVERCKQIGHAMTFVVVGGALDLAGPHW